MKNLTEESNTVISELKNLMLEHSPHLLNEWDFKKNDELGLDIQKMTKGLAKKVWWICHKCKSNYDSSIRNKCEGSKCPYCSGRRVNHTNSLATLNPELAEQWHPTLNGELTPHDVTCGSSRKIVWWICELGHEWEARVGERKYGGCPYCSGHRVMKGFNDINTTSIKLSKILMHHEDGYNYSKGSKVKLDWRCECGQIIKNKSPFIVDKEGLCCPNCSDGKSYPEKFVYHLLKQLNIKFKWEKTFKWSQGKRYDFYLPTHNMIIEVHGSQHYTNGFENIGGRTLQYEQENDQLKEILAKENGIKQYIVIDARESTMDWMKNSILNSTLSIILNISKINYDELDLMARKKILIEIENLWLKNKSIKLISSLTGLDRHCTLRYLKKIDAFDIKEDVDYIDSKRIIEYNLKTHKIKERMMSDFEKDEDFSISVLATIRKAKDNYYFKRDYFFKNIEGIKNKITELSFSTINKRKIFQLNYNLELVKIWGDDCGIIASNFNLRVENLHAHLRGVQKSFANYLWSYEDELFTRTKYFKDSFNNQYLYFIYQFDLEGNLIRNWRNSSNTEIQDNITINFKHIKKKVLDKNHYYKGFIFLKSYKYDEIKDKDSFFKEMRLKYKYK